MFRLTPVLSSVHYHIRLPTGMSSLDKDEAITKHLSGREVGQELTQQGLRKYTIYSSNGALRFANAPY